MTRKEILTYSVAVLIILATLAGMVAQPYFEASTFNRLTGGEANYFDALFSNLRVCR